MARSRSAFVFMTCSRNRAGVIPTPRRASPPVRSPGRPDCEAARGGGERREHYLDGCDRMLRERGDSVECQRPGAEEECAMDAGPPRQRHIPMASRKAGGRDSGFRRGRRGADKSSDCRYEDVAACRDRSFFTSGIRANKPGASPVARRANSGNRRLMLWPRSVRDNEKTIACV